MELLEFNHKSVIISVPRDPYRVLYEANCPMNHENAKVTMMSNVVAAEAPMENHSQRLLMRLPAL